MLSKSATTDKPWYDSLKDISNIDNVVQIRSTAVKGINDDNCLGIIMSKSDSIPFAMKSLDCNNSAFAICKTESSSFAPGQPLPRFPCIPPLKARKKRSTGEAPKTPTHSETTNNIDLKLK